MALELGAHGLVAGCDGAFDLVVGGGGGKGLAHDDQGVRGSKTGYVTHSKDRNFIFFFGKFEEFTELRENVFAENSFRSTYPQARGFVLLMPLASGLILDHSGKKLY